MKKPFFTIVTPTLNSEKYLKECIKSIKSQSFSDWEHIFIDSFSSDKTIKILNEYKKRNPKKVFIYQYPKAGISDAFNKGIKHSKGDYINFLGSDDLLEKEALQIVYDNMKDGRFSWCYGNFDIINEGGGVIKKKKYFYKNFHYWMLFFWFYICHQTVFMNRRLFKKYGGFNLNSKYAMDHDLFLKVGRKQKAVKINKVLCKFRRDGQNITSKLWKRQSFEKAKIELKNNWLLFYLSIPFKLLDFTINLLKGK